MAEHRTRKQKEHAQQLRVSQGEMSAYSWSQSTAATSEVGSKKSLRLGNPNQTSNSSQLLFGYDTHLITKDILKTVIIAALLFVVLLALRWYWYR